MKNLFIVDGSIWVTSGGVNPTSTIQALALYIADTSSSASRPCSTEARIVGQFWLERSKRMARSRVRSPRGRPSSMDPLT